MAQTITVPHAGEGVLSALPNVQVTSFQYTAFGEQMNTAVKVSGFTYNAEQYDAATGLLNLRARQYEPAMNRFSQKDKLRGSASTPLSLNRYGYVQNDPINLIDPSGMRLVDMQVNGEYYSEDEFHQKVDNLRSAANAALKAGNQQEADKIASRAMSFMESGYDYLTPTQKQAYSNAKSQLATAPDPEERKRIIREACMTPEEVEAQKQQEVQTQAEPTLADYWNAALYDNNRRFNEMTNAPSLTSILNYFSYGALEANAARYETAQQEQSFYAWGNYLSSGYFDSVNGAINAEKPLSWEHWMDSLSAAMPVLGIWGYSTNLGSSIVTPKDLILHGDKFGAVPYGSNLPVGTVGDTLGVSGGAGNVDNFIKLNVPDNFQNSVKNAFADDVKVQLYQKI